MAKYGKDNPGNFIEGALHGGSGPSDEITNESIGNGQTINRAYGMDNVGKVAGPHIETSLKDHGGFGGGSGYVGHSLSGATAVTGVGAAGKKG